MDLPRAWEKGEGKEGLELMPKFLVLAKMLAVTASPSDEEGK